MEIASKFKVLGSRQILYDNCSLRSNKAKINDQKVLRGKASSNNRENNASKLRVEYSDDVAATPHSGYHWDGTNRRFFEGWYFRVTLPKEKQSFALIYSIEDNEGSSKFSGIGAQVMGPSDGYIVQHDFDVRKFWAEKHSMILGACFKTKNGKYAPKRLISKAAFENSVALGFQSNSQFQQGKIIQSEVGTQGHIDADVDSCEWCFDVKQINGWGDEGKEQKATAGWLSALPIFEPHWQVLMSHGLATGTFKWGDKLYEFENAPTYYEKNWGSGFPSKWHWIQCNSFDQEKSLSVTAVGARRKLIGPQTVEEDVGMIGIHYKGKFYELVPWKGECSWRVMPWGSWEITASNENYEATITVICKSKGTPLRAPVDGEGLTPFCRDSFFGECELILVKKGTDKSIPEIIVEAKSDLAAVEVGGGPWWDEWKAEAQMKEPLKSLIKLPIEISTLIKLTPFIFRPPGV